MTTKEVLKNLIINFDNVLADLQKDDVGRPELYLSSTFRSIKENWDIVKRNLPSANANKLIQEIDKLMSVDKLFSERKNNYFIFKPNIAIIREKLSMIENTLSLGRR